MLLFGLKLRYTFDMTKNKRLILLVSSISSGLGILFGVVAFAGTGFGCGIGPGGDRFWCDKLFILPMLGFIPLLFLMLYKKTDKLIFLLLSLIPLIFLLYGFLHLIFFERGAFTPYKAPIMNTDQVI